MLFIKKEDCSHLSLHSSAHLVTLGALARVVVLVAVYTKRVVVVEDEEVGSNKLAAMLAFEAVFVPELAIKLIRYLACVLKRFLINVMLFYKFLNYVFTFLNI